MITTMSEEKKAGNIAIDIFMTSRQLFDDCTQLGHLRGSGPRYYNYYDTVEVKNLKYHKDWNALMPVVEKIEAMGYTVVMLANTCRINFDGSDDIKADTKIETTYQAVLSFIEYYNTTIKNQKQ
jgi:hypothetical protein